MIKHRKLRTDLPLMGDKEVLGWAANIIENTNKIDIEILAERINAAIEEDRLALTFERVTNMCDKCERSFPEHITECDKCGNDKLRSFKVYNNLHEFVK